VIKTAVFGIKKELPMSTKETSVRDKIVQAAIDCIEREGIQAVTIRSIAKEAGVNSAAINYYFRTKEILVKEALQFTINHVISDWEQIFNLNNLSPRARVELFFKEFMDGAVRFPGISKAHLFEPFVQNKNENDFVRSFNGFLKTLLKQLKKAAPSQTEKQLKFTVVQMVTSIMFTALMPDFFQDLAGISFKDAKARKTFVDHLMEHYLPAERI
jgi:AcrR family transcriptional regulator